MMAKMESSRFYNKSKMLLLISIHSLASAYAGRTTSNMATNITYYNKKKRII